MALREEVVLDVQNALRELERIRQQLSELGTPVNVPVNVEGEEALARLDQQVRDAGGIVDVDVDQSSLQGAESTVEGLNRELDQTADELRQASREADEFGDELQSSGQRGTQAVGGIRSSLGPLLAGAAAGFGFRAIIDGFRQAIDSATALEESINAVNVTFLEGAATVRGFGEDAAENVGLAASEFNSLVVPIGALLQNFNLDGQEAADAALELTTRAADLASVFNVDVQDALTAIGSALRGETEPIRQFGVNLNQAGLDAKALELGLVEVGEEVTIAERGQAAYAEVLEQTSRFAGDFARTSENAANQQRILAAAVEEARVGLGEALLPAFEGLLEEIPALLEGLEAIAPLIGGIGSASIGIISDVLAVVTGLVDIGEAIAEVTFELDQLPDDLPFAEGVREGASRVVNPLSDAADAIRDVQSLLAIGISERGLESVLEDLEEAAGDADDPVRVLAEAFAELFNDGVNAVAILEDLADAADLSDEQLGQFIQALLLSSGSLDLTVDQLATLRDILEEIGGVQPGAPLAGLEDLAVPEALQGLSPFVTETLVGFDQIEEGINEVSDRFDNIDWDAPPPENVPVIIDDLFDLRDAAEEAGQTVQEFLESDPEGFVIDLSDAEQEVLGLIETLEGAGDGLEQAVGGAFEGLRGLIDEETDIITADVDEFISRLAEIGESQAEFEGNLAEIVTTLADAGIGQDVIDVLVGDLANLGPEVAGPIAESLAEDSEAAIQAAEAIAGTGEFLADEAANQLAETMATATPEAIAALRVFGAENFVSNQVRDQLDTTATLLGEEIAEKIGLAASNTVIPLDLVFDLSSSEIIGSPRGGGGAAPVTSDGEPIGGQRLEININNATTEDLSTSATQAGQTIQAVSQVLGRVR